MLVRKAVIYNSKLLYFLTSQASNSNFLVQTPNFMGELFRSESENEAFAKTGFNEENWVDKLGMKYISIPIDGYDSYTSENVQKLADTLDGTYKNALVHCASCGRVSYFIMACLVDYKGYKLSDAVEFGKQLKFQIAFEYLLEEEISWETE